MIINEKNYKKEVIKSKVPVLLTFTSSFLFKNTLDDLSRELAGKVKVGMVDLNHTDLLRKYNITLLPCSLLIKDNTVTERIIGNPGKENLLRILTYS